MENNKKTWVLSFDCECHLSECGEIIDDNVTFDDLGYRIDFEQMEGKVSLIRQMISRVEIWKKSRYEPVADVYTKVDGFVYHIFMNSYNGTSYMTSEPYKSHIN